MNSLIISRARNIKIINVGLICLYLIILWTYPVLIYGTLENNSVKEIIASFLYHVALFVFLYNRVHEYSHAAMAKILNYDYKVHLGKDSYISFSTALKKRDFILIILTPFVVNVAEILLYFILFSYNPFIGLLIICFTLMGCMSDFSLALKATKYRKNTLFIYKEPGVFETIEEKGEDR